jgi:hypothetical protein
LDSVEIQLADDLTSTSCESYSQNEDTIFTYFVKLEEAITSGAEGRKEPSGLTQDERAREDSMRGSVAAGH